MTESQNKHVILYADDDEDDRMLLKETFIDYSNNVELVCVTNGLEAISYLESLYPSATEPCLVILDINMPLMDGRKTLKSIREKPRYKDMPVVMFSTSSQNSDKEFAAKHDAAFVTKPVSMNQLYVIVDIFIDQCSDDVRKSIRTQ